jgi:hypothetical protein
MWLGTHAIGMMRAARDLSAKKPDEIAFLDFDADFDAPQTIRPVVFSRQFWEKSLSVAIDDLAALVAPRLFVRCEGSSSASGDGFDAQIYEDIFANEFSDVRFISSGSENDLDKDLSVLTAAIQNRIPGLGFTRLYDRDDRSAAEISDIEAKGDHVLKRRHLESYLYDDETLKLLCLSAGKPELISEVLAAKQECVGKLPSRGRPIDDIKAASGEIFVAVKKKLGLTQGGNNARSFMRDTLAPLIQPKTAIYKELRADVFGKIT